MGALKPFATRYALTFKNTKTHSIINWSLDESENYDRFAIDDGSHWMCRASLRGQRRRSGRSARGQQSGNLSKVTRPGQSPSIRIERR